MTPDPLAATADPALFHAIADAIAALPDEPRQRAAAALHERRIAIAYTPEPGEDGTPMLVIDVSWLDEHGSHLLARFDAARFGFHHTATGITYRGQR